jgi:hypothetical protein
MSCAVEHDPDLGVEDVSGAGVRVIDIRGTRIRPAVPPVLADPSGVRARRLAHAGRAIAFLCLLWLAGLALAGIGILPANDLPLGRAITGAAPEVLGVAPMPAPSRFDPAGGPAANARATATAADRAEGTGARTRRAGPGARSGISGRESEPRMLGRSPGRSTTRRAPRPAFGTRGTGTPSETAAGSDGPASGPNQAAPAGVVNPGTHATRRGIATAPGRTVKAATRAHTGTAARGNSGAAPGHGLPTATTDIPARGQSGSSPGYTMTPGAGHGNGT